SGLCLDVRDGIARRGADAVTEICAGRLSQRWTYETDGLLRSAAAPALCLDSGRPDGVLALASCDREPGATAGPGGTGALRLRYELTAGGELLARRDDRQAVVPAAPGIGAPAVVRLRSDHGDNSDNSDNGDSGGEGSGPWRWRTEFSSPPPVRPAPAS
ncbi:hydrolase, partial [Streptomyces sp. SID5473]